jgi:proline dehydrogenase
MRVFHATIAALGFNETSLDIQFSSVDYQLIMLRSLLIYLSQADWARNFVMRLPLARRTALRFVAGEKLEDALRSVKELNLAGYQVTLDLLGEHTSTKILALIEAIAGSKLQSSISIKLSQIGLLLSEDLCAQNLALVLKVAEEKDIFVRIDMEDAASLEATLRLARSLGADNLGLVIQSYLYRSESDTRELVSEGFPIRLVKGAYKEAPELAYPKKKDVDEAFDRLTDFLLSASLTTQTAQNASRTRPPLAAIASHDEERIDFAKKRAADLGVAKEMLEFQMLYGIRRNLQEDLLAEGFPVRIYVPFGQEWYPYFMRRLAERPANLWFFLSNLVKR